MAQNNDRLELNIVSPQGTAIYPKLNEPDTKFDDAGVYETKLKFDPDDAEGVLSKKSATWAEMKEAIDAQQAEFLKQKKAELAKGDGKAKNKAKSIDSIEWGVEPDVDDEGNETGLVVIKAKMKASGVSKRDGRAWSRRPVIFDAKNTKLDPAPSIWGGSSLKVAGKIVPYYSAKDNVVGSTFYLEAVQVIELVSGQGREAGDYGFGEEEGYTAPTDDAPFEASDDDAGSF